MRASVEFWFEFASTYSYIAAEEIEAKAEAAQVNVVWRPFLLGPLFAAQGWADSPFNLYASKGAYMWRDMERLCALKAIEWRKPSVFPRNGLVAARIAISLDTTDAVAGFTKAVYRANFAHDQDIGDVDVLAALLDAQGLDANACLARSTDTAVKTLLRARTEEAQKRGVFGAPSFFIGDELFWGSDRLDQALQFAQGVKA